MSAVPTADTDLGSDLTLTANEIGKLVAQGDLEAAKEQLEATISRQDATAISALPDTITKPEQANSAETRPARHSHPKLPIPTPAKLDPASSDTYRTVIGMPLSRFKWVGLAAAILLSLGLLWAVLPGGQEIPKGPVVTEPVVAAVEQAVPFSQPSLGVVVVNASPWAEVTEITDSQGYVQELPSIPQTPLYLELAPGSYRINVRDASGEQVYTCELEVAVETVAPCTPDFAPPDVTEYFKESGWW